MWQEIAVWCVGILTLIYTVWKIGKFFTDQRKSDDFCHGCTGCSLHQNSKKHKSCCES